MSKEVSKKEIKDEKEGNIIQIGIVVRDIEETIDSYNEILDVGPWDIYTFSNEAGVRNFTWQGEEVEDFEYKIALATIGNLQFELMQPVYNVPVFENFLEEKGEGVHHIKQKVNTDNMESKVEEFKSKGISRIGGGEFDKDIFIYLDTESDLGVMLELGNNGEMRAPEKQYPPQD